MADNQQDDRPLDHGEINAELDALEGKNDPASNARRAGLFDELITLDMGMGGFRRAMGCAASRSPAPADADTQPADKPNTESEPAASSATGTAEKKEPKSTETLLQSAAGGLQDSQRRVADYWRRITEQLNLDAGGPNDRSILGLTPAPYSARPFRRQESERPAGVVVGLPPHRPNAATYRCVRSSGIIGRNRQDGGNRV